MDNSSNYKFVAFNEYCPICKYSDVSPAADPCNKCLGVGAREGTEKPKEFEEDT